jgi:hypothetical protein
MMCPGLYAYTFNGNESANILVGVEISMHNVLQINFIKKAREIFKCLQISTPITNILADLFPFSMYAELGMLF